MMYKVEGHSGLLKNPRTGTIINTNESEIIGARKRKQNRINLKEENENLKDEIKELKSSMNEIQSLLKQMVEKDGD